MTTNRIKRENRYTRACLDSNGTGHALVLALGGNHDAPASDQRADHRRRRRTVFLSHRQVRSRPAPGESAQNSGPADLYRGDPAAAPPCVGGEWAALGAAPVSIRCHSGGGLAPASPPVFARRASTGTCPARRSVSEGGESI